MELRGWAILWKMGYLCRSRWERGASGVKYILVSERKGGKYIEGHKSSRSQQAWKS